MPPFSFIVTFRFTPDRILNLRRVLEWISGFQGVEIIVVEQDRNTKIDNLPLPGKHIFLYNPGTFNKSWAYNVGWKHSTSPLVVFGDADVLMDPNLFSQALSQVENNEVVNPYSSVIDLEDWESSQDFGTILKISRSGRGESDHQKVPFCGGITIFRKESIDRICGWPEEYIGWGGEDDAMSVKVKKLLKYVEMPNRSYHLHHSRVSPDMVEYKRNLDLLNKFKDIDIPSLEKYIQNLRGKIGIENKFI